MKAFLAIGAPLATFMLCACSSRHEEADGSIAEQAAAKTFELGIQQQQLSDRMNAYDARLDGVVNYVDAVDGARQQLTKTFNSNVKIDNEKTAAQMTLRGDCGVEWRQLDSGGFMRTNKTCTTADLK